jgi:hypothetical protein
MFAKPSSTRTFADQFNRSAPYRRDIPGEFIDLDLSLSHGVARETAESWQVRRSSAIRRYRSEKRHPSPRAATAARASATSVT